MLHPVRIAKSRSPAASSLQARVEAEQAQALAALRMAKEKGKAVRDKLAAEAASARRSAADLSKELAAVRSAGLAQVQALSEELHQLKTSAALSRAEQSDVRSILRQSVPSGTDTVQVAVKQRPPSSSGSAQLKATSISTVGVRKQLSECTAQLQEALNASNLLQQQLEDEQSARAEAEHAQATAREQLSR